MLSFRLQKIKAAINPGADLVWDLCCDHGILGKSLLDDGKEVFFVDQVSHIINHLVDDLAASTSKYTCIVSDAAEINIKNKVSETVVIAGVGGFTCKNILEALITKYGYLKSEFVLSPQKNLPMIYEYLRVNQFNIISEDIFEDNKKLYHVLKIRQRAKS